MKDKSLLSLSTRLLLYAGNVMIVVPLSIYLLWVYASITSENFFDAVELFDNALPDFLKGPDGALKISLICGLLSLTSGIAGLKMRIFPWKLNMLLVVVNSLLLSLNIFQLM